MSIPEFHRGKEFHSMAKQQKPMVVQSELNNRRKASYRREDVCVVAADGVGFAAVGGLGVELLGLVVVGGALLLLLLLLAVAVVPLANPHHLHPPLLPADDD